jgi:Spy/CpxP family protein refolding chaperone
MFKKILWVTGALALVAGLLFSSCHRWRHHHGMSKEKIEWMQKHIASELKLDAEQKIKLAEIAKRFSDKIPEMKERRIKIADVATKTFESEKFDAQPVNAELDAMQKHFSEMKTMAVQALGDFHAILTPDQRKKLVEIMKKHQEHFNE